MGFAALNPSYAPNRKSGPIALGSHQSFWQHRMNQGLTILVFDSGLGGLTVFREIAQARPDAAYVYVADDDFFPYARRSEEQLVGREVPLMQEMIATHAPDLVWIAFKPASPPNH